jgi:hypothetical protein
MGPLQDWARRSVFASREDAGSERVGLSESQRSCSYRSAHHDAFSSNPQSGLGDTVSEPESWSGEDNEQSECHVIAHRVVPVRVASQKFDRENYQHP